VIADNRHQPAWWVESRAGDEAGRIEKTLARGLWVLETIVTAAPLLGLLGTITGMMQSFNVVIGASTLVAPTQVTAGVAQALMRPALGLLIAVLSLFAFNLFSRMQSQALRHDGAAGLAAGRSYYGSTRKAARPRPIPRPAASRPHERQLIRVTR